MKDVEEIYTIVISEKELNVIQIVLNGSSKNPTFDNIRSEIIKLEHEIESIKDYR